MSRTLTGCCCDGGGTGPPGPVGPAGPPGPNCIGMISIWTSTTLPDVATCGTYLRCDGLEYDIVDYPELHAVILLQYGTPSALGKFKVPNLRNRFPYQTAGSLGTTGGDSSVTLLVSNLPAHNHRIAPISVTGTAASAGNHQHSTRWKEDESSQLGAVKVGGTPGSILANGSNLEIANDTLHKYTNTTGAHTHAISGTTAPAVTDNTGLGNSFDIINPWLNLIYIIFAKNI